MKIVMMALALMVLDFRHANLHYGLSKPYMPMGRSVAEFFWKYHGASEYRYVRREFKIMTDITSV